MPNVYTVKLQKNGQLIQQRQVHPALTESTGAVRFKAQPDGVYVLSTEGGRKPVSKIFTQRAGNDLLLVLEGDPTDKPQMIIEAFFAPHQNMALATQNSQGELVVFSADAARGLADAAHAETWQAQIARGVDEAWYSGSGTQLALIAGGLLLVSAGKNSSGSESPSSAQDTIAAYASGAAQANTPTDTTYKDAGYSGVTPSNVSAINSALQRTHTKDSTGIQKIITAYQNLINKANGNSPDNTTNDPTLQDYQTLGVVLLNLERSDNPNALALLTDIIKGRTLGDINTVTKLDGFAAIADKILLLAKGDTPPVALSAAELNSIGLTDVLNEGQMAAIRSAIGASADDGSGVKSVAQLTAIQNAYLKVLAQADGTRGNTTEASKTPTVAELTTLGVKLGKAGNTSDAQHASALGLLNDMVDGLNNTAVDSVKEINDLASTIDKLMGIATATTADQASALGLSASELSAWGLTSVNSDNLAQVVEAVRLTQSTDGKKLNAFKQVQSAVDLGLIMQYAESSPLASTGHVAPTMAQYISAGVLSADAGNNKAINASNLAAINSAVEALHALDVNSVAKLQKVVNAYVKLLNLANGVKDNNSESLTLDDYKALGALTNFDSTTGAIDGKQTAKAATDSSAQKDAALNLLNSVINARSATQVDSIAEINALSMAADRVLDLTSSATNNALKVGDFSLLGIQNVNEGNLAEVKQNLNDASANASSGTNIDSLEEIQSAVSLAVLELFADNAATYPLPTAQSTVTQLYKDLILPNSQLAWTDDLANGVSSVVNFLSKDNITLAKVSEIASAYQSVLLEATQGSSNNNTNPSAAQYQSLLDPLNNKAAHVFENTTQPELASNALALLNDVVRQKAPSKLSSYSTLENYANAIDKLMNLAAMPSNGAPAANDIQLTIADLTNLGFNVSSSWTGTPSGTASGFTYKVANSDDHGAAIRTWDQVQNLISQSSVF